MKNLKSMARGAPIYRAFAPWSCATRIRHLCYIQLKFEPGFGSDLVDFWLGKEVSCSAKSSWGRRVRHGLVLATGPHWAARTGRKGDWGKRPAGPATGFGPRLGKGIVTPLNFQNIFPNIKLIWSQFKFECRNNSNCKIIYNSIHQYKENYATAWMRQPIIYFLN
jgi:hypothetical protein